MKSKDPKDPSAVSLGKKSVEARRKKLGKGGFQKSMKDLNEKRWNIKVEPSQ